MKFADFKAAHDLARSRLKGLEGDDNWPGLTTHDRAYALPVDYQGEAYTAIVRAQSLYEHESCPIKIELWHWHWRGGQDGNFDKLNAEQLAACADIKRVVRRWLDGLIDELPPSTCVHLKRHTS